MHDASAFSLAHVAPGHNAMCIFARNCRGPLLLGDNASQLFRVTISMMLRGKLIKRPIVSPTNHGRALDFADDLKAALLLLEDLLQRLELRHAFDPHGLV